MAANAADSTLRCAVHQSGYGRGRPIERFKWHLVTRLLGLPLDVVVESGLVFHFG